MQAGRPRSGGLACNSGSHASCLHFRIAGIFACVLSDSQAKRLHHRIAGVSPACGCTQTLMRELKIATDFWFALRQSAGGTPAIRRSRLHFRIACGCTQPLMRDLKIATDFWFALRQSAGGTPAIRRSRLLFRIAGISGSRAFRLGSFRIAGGLACIPMNF
ncbi:MAG: hypothetical protein LBP59_04755 [Planctomycetaceae bacterium]|nr:hypothetical protein [Planctomycetaceae bacterium]